MPVTWSQKISFTTWCCGRLCYSYNGIIDWDFFLRMLISRYFFMLAHGSLPAFTSILFWKVSHHFLHGRSRGESDQLKKGITILKMNNWSKPMSSRDAWLFPIVCISFQYNYSYSRVTQFQSAVLLGFYVIVKYSVASKFAVFNTFHPMISRRTTLETLLCIQTHCSKEQRRLESCWPSDDSKHSRCTWRDIFISLGERLWLYYCLSHSYPLYFKSLMQGLQGRQR